MTYRRVELPSRRPGYTVPVIVDGRTWDITIGLDHQGQAREAFIEAPSDSGGWVFLAHDIAIVLSHLLQRDMRAAELRPLLSDRPPSLLAVVMAAAEEIEKEFGAGIAALYAEHRADQPLQSCEHHQV